MEKTQEKSFEEMNWEVELLSDLAEAEEDVKAGRIGPIQLTFDRIRRELKERFK